MMKRAKEVAIDPGQSHYEVRGGHLFGLYSGFKIWSSYTKT